MRKQTAELSSHQNWIAKKLRHDGIDIFGVEGYTKMNKDISMFIDRRRVTDVRGWNAESVLSEYENNSRDGEISAKTQLANCGGCGYHLCLYDKQYVRVYEITDNAIFTVSSLLDYAEFGKWLSSKKSKKEVKKGFINMDQLPEIDTKLRKLGTSWPSNLDGFWWDNTVRSLIEFQTTVKASVMNHSNNRYFTQDEGRWRSLDVLRNAIDVPLIILTWSPNEDDNWIKIKKVGRINYSGRDRGLNYTDERLLKGDEVADMMEQIL